MFLDPNNLTYMYGCLLEIIAKQGIYGKKSSMEYYDLYSKVTYHLCTIPILNNIYNFFENRLITKFPSLQNLKNLFSIYDSENGYRNILKMIFINFRCEIHFVLYIKKMTSQIHRYGLTKNYVKIDNIDDVLGSLNKILYIINFIFKAKTLKIPYLFIYSSFIATISILPIATKAFHLLNDQYNKKQTNY